MEKVELIQSALINSDFDSFKKELEDYEINSFDQFGNNVLHNYLLSFDKIKIDPKSMLDFLVSKRIDINKKQQKGNFKRSPLHIAVFTKNKTVFDYLTDLDVEINSTDKNGNTIISTAISRINFGEDGGYFIQKLIKLGANLNMKNKHGISAKDWALRFPKNEGARIYIDDSLFK